MGIGSRLMHAWNVFTDREDDTRFNQDRGAAYGVRPDRPRMRFSNERTIISSIYTRIAIDVAAIDIRHVKLDDGGRYKEDMDSHLNNCLSVEANLDQSPRSLIKDTVLNLFDQGSAAIVPVETSINPRISSGYDIHNLRVGEITQWHPRSVRVNLYNEDTGMREEVPLEKRTTAIVYNPLYEVMNEPNSTLQRLIRKLNLLDAVDEQSASGKLDLIIQLPYVIKSEARRKQADQRRKDIEVQLQGSKYGVAYTDGTEKVTQLNRPAENNLMNQIEYLTTMLYGQLGITAEIMNGTADEAAMLNYHNRTIEPILSAITDEMRRKFLTKTGRTQGQSIEFYRDAFKLTPMKDVAEMADKFTRNEIFTANEIRQFVGQKPSQDPKANKLMNSNMPQPLELPAPAEPDLSATTDVFADVNQVLDDVFSELGVSEDA